MLNIADIETMIETLKILKPNAKVNEIRIFGKDTKNGFFNDYSLLKRELKKISHDNAIYFVMNDIDETKIDLSNINKFKVQSGTKADAIKKREWLLIDYDVDRASNTCSTDAEKQIAYEKMIKVGMYLKSCGFNSPVICTSGNGYHCLYKINEENNAEVSDKIKRLLDSLSILFTDTNIKIDSVVGDACRITRLYGSWNIKGENTKERPYRQSKILKIPNEILSTSLDKFEKVYNDANNYKQKTIEEVGNIDLKKFLDTYKVKYSAKGEKFILDVCPFDSEHGKDSAVWKMPNGALVFKCFHNGCANNTWKEFKNLVAPNYHEDKKESINPEDLYQELDDIPYDTSPLDRVYSNIRRLDELIGGFTYNCITLWSAQTNAGKSVLLSSLIKEFIKQGKKIFIFNGEKDIRSFKNELYLQCVTDFKKQVIVKKIDDRNIFEYYVKPEYLKDIERFYRGNVIIYDNNKPRDINTMLKAMTSAYEKYGVRDFICDNLMQLTISGNDILKGQKDITEKLRIFAINKHCNIHLVAHPRKSNDNNVRVSIWDVSGAMEIVNKAYNVITIIRKDHLVKDSQEYNVLKNLCYYRGYDFDTCDAIIEVLKQKDGQGTGIVCLQFNKETKTFIEMPRDDRNISKAINKTKRRTE